MSFDPTAYASLQAINPEAAASYLASTQGAQSPPAANNPPPASTPPAAGASQSQGQFYQNQNAVQQLQTLARGTLEDFYNQPTGSGGGPSITSKFFNKRAFGSWLQLEVAADSTDADVRQQTTPQGIPQTFKDGRPKFVLVVKVKVLGSSDGTHVTEFPDGMGSLWVKGVLADELRRSMAAVGDASGYPKAGAIIVMSSTGEQASRTPGFSATKLYKLDYANPATDLQAVAQAANPVDPANTVPFEVEQSAPATVPSASSAAPVSTPAPVSPPPAAGSTKAELMAKLSGANS